MACMLEATSTEPLVPASPTRRLALRHLPLLLLSLPAAGCGGSWEAIRLPTPAPLRPGQQVQVWRQGTALRLHGVVMTPDSVIGIPFLQPLECDSCRVALPLATVDSLRAGDPEGGFWATAVLGMFGMVIGIFIGCSSGTLDCTWAGS
jgi:hypothetical protein